eukprot:3209843-Karenia_brevis.AAC.1
MKPGEHLKLHFGMTGPSPLPEVTSMNDIRRGKYPNLHLGMTVPKAHQRAQDLTESHIPECDQERE